MSKISFENGLEFFWDFDSGNVRHVEQIAPNEFYLTVAPDADGTPNVTTFKSWFYFGIRGIVTGNPIHITVANLNKQSDLYKHGYRPVYRVVPHMQSFRHIPSPAQFSYSEGQGKVRFSFTLETKTSEAVYFAHFFPFSYIDSLALLDTIESTYGNGAFEFDTTNHDLNELNVTSIGTTSETVPGTRSEPRSEPRSEMVSEPLSKPASKPISEPNLQLDASHTYKSYQSIPNNIYFARELLVRSVEGRRVDLLTITSMESTTVSVPIRESDLRKDGMFPELHKSVDALAFVFKNHCSSTTHTSYINKSDIHSMAHSSYSSSSRTSTAHSASSSSSGTSTAYSTTATSFSFGTNTTIESLPRSNQCYNSNMFRNDTINSSIVPTSEFRSNLCNGYTQQRNTFDVLVSCHSIEAKCRSLRQTIEKVETTCAKWKRSHDITHKPIVFISARVHPGETPASFVMNGILELLLNPSDPVAKMLRHTFIFKIVPMLNPDGVSLGHYRADSFGENLNRLYTSPNASRAPSIFAVKQLLEHYASQKRLFMYLDLHAHASKRGCFFYGNHIGHVQRQLWTNLFPKLASMYSSHIDFLGNNFSAKNMHAKDKRDKAGATKEGAGRVAVYISTGCFLSYTLECNYNNDARTHKAVGYILQEELREFGGKKTSMLLSSDRIPHNSTVKSGDSGYPSAHDPSNLNRPKSNRQLKGYGNASVRYSSTLTNTSRNGTLRNNTSRNGISRNTALKNGTFRNSTDTSSFQSTTARYTPNSWRSVGKAMLHGLVELVELHPHSCLGRSEFKTLVGMKKSILRQLVTQPSYTNSAKSLLHSSANNSNHTSGNVSLTDSMRDLLDSTVLDYLETLQTMVRQFQTDQTHRERSRHISIKQQTPRQWTLKQQTSFGHTTSSLEQVTASSLEQTTSSCVEHTTKLSHRMQIHDRQKRSYLSQNDSKKFNSKHSDSWYNSNRNLISKQAIPTSSYSCPTNPTNIKLFSSAYRTRLLKDKQTKLIKDKHNLIQTVVNHTNPQRTNISTIPPKYPMDSSNKKQSDLSKNETHEQNNMNPIQPFLPTLPMAPLNPPAASKPKTHETSKMFVPKRPSTMSKQNTFHQTMNRTKPSSMSTRPSISSKLLK